MEEAFNISSTDYWFKIVEFLQQNWAVIEQNNSGCTVFFFGDTADVFDQLDFPSISDAEAALKRNGFARYDEDKNAQEYIARPKPPFRRQPHPNGAIYSSGRYWR